MNIPSELEALVSTFQRDLTLADSIYSPNVEDDRLVKLAIVGFSYRNDTSQWGYEEYQSAVSWINSEYPDSELFEFGNGGERVRWFASLANGFLLGLRKSGAIDDEELKRLQSLIHGIVMLHASQITAG